MLDPSSVCRLLVIGGSGYVGRLLLPFLAKEFSVTVFDPKPPPQGSWKHVSADVQNRKALEKVIKGMDALLYLARGSSNQNKNDIASEYDVNVKGLHLALEASRRAGIKRAVYASTLSVYDRHGDIAAFTTGAMDKEEVPPLAKSVYGLTKQIGEQVCQFYHECYRLPVLVLRLFLPVSLEVRRTKSFEGLVDCRTEAPDLARAVVSALASTHKEFEIIHITGDRTGRAYRHEKAKKILNWEPRVV